MLRSFKVKHQKSPHSQKQLQDRNYRHGTGIYEVDFFI